MTHIFWKILQAESPYDIDLHFFFNETLPNLLTNFEPVYQIWFVHNSTVYNTIRTIISQILGPNCDSTLILKITLHLLIHKNTPSGHTQKFSGSEDVMKNIYSHNLTVWLHESWTIAAKIPAFHEEEKRTGTKRGF